MNVKEIDRLTDRQMDQWTDGCHRPDLSFTKIV